MADTSSDVNRIKEPFLLAPAGKDYLWGGSRLNDDFAKGIEMSPLAESWECSTHPDGLSIVRSGEYDGKELASIIKMHPEMLGTHPKSDGELPILIKLIDAREELSIQVHPSDEYARENENGELGKTEAWYILDAAKDAKIIYGFHHDIDRDTLRASVEDGTIEKYLRKVSVKKDDVFFIESGTIHAIGAGVLAAEIQENSNLTYRLFDYNRVGKDGRKRPLHIEKALDVVDLRTRKTPVQPMRTLKFYQGYATDLLCRCKYFQVERLLLNTEIRRNLASFKSDSTSFQVLLCLDGCGVIFWGGGGLLNFHKGDCVFVPSDSVEFRLHGKAQLLRISC